MNDVIWQPGITMEQVERRVIERALRFHSMDKQATANSLGIAKRTVDAKIAKYEKDDQARAARMPKINEGAPARF